MATVVVGATRGLGAAICKHYLSKGLSSVYGTTRKPQGPSSSDLDGIKWITGVDIGTPAAGGAFVSSYGSSEPISTLVVSAGFFGKETFDELDWKAQTTMYTTSAIGPVFLVQALVKAGLLKEGSKVVMVSSESGSIALRHAKEGGGNYGHHASKAALNMAMKLLSLDLADHKITVVSVHPGFMRTEMTKGVGYDKFWDAGGSFSAEFTSGTNQV
jgi:NAD(P)-dependent dehydrogenase (short-subunit alcohol dehydrogenase family)